MSLNNVWNFNSSEIELSDIDRHMKFHYNHAHLFIGSSKFELSLIGKKLKFLYIWLKVSSTQKLSK